jgi:ABC-type uncharacterized transport system involved in gliding motility auxiliary subunit
MRSALHAGMTLVVLLLVFLAFNLVWAGKLPDLRWDASHSKTNTLSAPVQQLLASLDSPLDLYYFNSNGHPKKSQATQRYAKRVEETLKAFEVAAQGMINLHIIDPGAFSEDAYRAGLYGLDDEAGFFGLIGTRDGQPAQRITSFSADRATLLEYEISHLISQLLHPQPPAIGLLSGLPIKELAGPLLQDLQRHLNVVELEPSVHRVPAQIKTLMLVHPRALPEQTLYAIDQFVLGGGKLMMFIDPLSEQGSRQQALNPRLEALLSSWGIRMPAGQVLIDSRYTTQAPAGTFPTLLSLPRQAMAANDISTWKLDVVSVSSSGALFPLDKHRTRFTPLLYSSEQSALLEADRVGKSPDAGEPPSSGVRHVIAARLEGPAYSAFPDGMGGQAPGLQKAAQIQVVVVADTDVLMRPSTRLTPHSNSLFVLNTLDNLAAPQALADIRPRPPTQYTLHSLENQRKATARAYQEQASELERRLAQTEYEWRRLNPAMTTLGTETINTNAQLQAHNKERLRLTMELHALKVAVYAPLDRLVQNVKLGVSAPIPILLCLTAWGLYLRRRRRHVTP